MLSLLGFPRLGDSTEALSSAGRYDPARRKLTIGPTNERAWAFSSTSSERLGFFWSESGAAALNSRLVFENYFDIYFDEVRTPACMILLQVCVCVCV
jgi:hypothetical protein